MNTMTLTEVQSKIGEVSIALLRGESITITRNGKKLGVIIPAKEPADMAQPEDLEISKPNATPKVTITQSAVDKLNEGQPAEKTFNKCEVPPGNCRGMGLKYKITYMGEEGEESKEVYLCGIHKKAAIDNGTKVEEVQQNG